MIHYYTLGGTIMHLLNKTKTGGEEKKKDGLKLQYIFFFKVHALIYYFEVLHIQIFIQQNIMGAMKF